MLTYNTIFYVTVFGVFFVLFTAFNERLYIVWKVAVAYLVLCMVLLIVYAGKVMLS